MPLIVMENPQDDGRNALGRSPDAGHKVDH